MFKLLLKLTALMTFIYIPAILFYFSLYINIITFYENERLQQEYLLEDLKALSQQESKLPDGMFLI